MTPLLKSTLKDMGVTAREFAALTGLSEDTVSGWGKRHRAARGTQQEPPWVWCLVDAWRHSPEALAVARRRVAEVG